MRSAIFSIVSGIVLTLLLRGPAPTPPAPPPQRPALTAAVAGPAEAIPACVVEAPSDSLPAWLAGGQNPGTAAVVVTGDGMAWCRLEIWVRVSHLNADTCRCREYPPAATSSPY
ncbi:MAG: hypothetical protein JSW46_03245 [Gemmatimonadota bacterium]|nr:MAG: hypothetical protein JSW46_03245 [Gemmatimonadota bacterium]